MLSTRLTDALQIEHPVMLAGMGGVSYHRLVTAVSEAGGFGCLGASTMGDDEMRSEIAAVAGATAVFSIALGLLYVFGLDVLPPILTG